MAGKIAPVTPKDDSAATLSVRAVRSIEDVAPLAWDGLAHGGSPFLRHGFLAALEASRSIGARSGWAPVYLLAEAGAPGARRLLGAVAAFVKSHSYGEYIFDWGWASASERAGVPYYPKLVVHSPATPATGPRILLDAGADADAVTAVLVAGVRAVADEARCSSIHWLFTTAEEQRRLELLGFASRASYQFHWHNRGWSSWDDFLASLTSRKRKQLRKERQRALAAVDRVEMVPARELDAAALDDLDRFYRATVDDHGGSDYLRPRFFHLLAERMPDEMLLCQAMLDGRRLAGALFFDSGQALYGRYWGADARVELLHFEVAYYAGIERCIQRGLPLFEAGAQGEHKLLRGFLPASTYSSHWLRHPGLDDAVRDFLDRERAGVALRMAQLTELGPFRHEGATESDSPDT
jgi:predicted N-acyltransferase